MEVTQGISTVSEQAEIDEMKGKYLTFWTDGQLFGVPISDVVQIIGIQ
jgi:purine-binding chemotaxis protein CheW